jgi:hypothetical protein
VLLKETGFEQVPLEDSLSCAEAAVKSVLNLVNRYCTPQARGSCRSSRE